MNSVDFKTSIIAYLRKREKEYDIEKGELKNEMEEFKIKNLNEMVLFGKNLIIVITFIFAFCSLTNASISIKSSF